MIPDHPAHKQHYVVTPWKTYQCLKCGKMMKVEDIKEQAFKFLHRWCK